MQRRTLLRGAALTVLGGSLWRGAFSSCAPKPAGPYGPLQPPDDNLVELPEGFTSRIVARSTERVPGTSYTWHDAPDGGACYPDGDGWIYVSNSEVSDTGGVGAVRFDADGRIDSAYRILDGTNRNCAGGRTPWDTWLSCEEVDRGTVFETDPYGRRDAVRRPALGWFRHEAAAVDPVRRVVYLTEDEPDGNFYRFVPSAWPDLADGTLEVLATQADGETVRWVAVPDPAARGTRTRHQVAAAKRFDGGEGCYYADDVCYFTTKGDNRVWAYHAADNRLRVRYDGKSPLSGVDNLTGVRSGNLYVAEDGGNMEICVITPDDVVAPILRLVDQELSEITGPAFSPDGTRLYFSSQRGTTGVNTGGITYEVRGPFHRGSPAG